MLCVCTCLWRCKRLRFWNPKIITDYIYFDESSAKSENGRHTFSQLAVITFNYFHHRLCLVHRPQASVHSAQAAYHNRLTIVRMNSCKGTSAGTHSDWMRRRKSFAFSCDICILFVVPLPTAIGKEQQHSVQRFLHHHLIIIPFSYYFQFSERSPLSRAHAHTILIFPNSQFRQFTRRRWWNAEQEITSTEEKGEKKKLHEIKLTEY